MDSLPPSIRIDDISSISSDIAWINHLPEKIGTVFLGPLYGNGVINEIHNTFRRPFLRRRRLVKSEQVGVWGWNTWCGVHLLPILTGPSVHEVLKRTFDVGLSRADPETGLLPHAVMHEGGNFASGVEYMCYGGKGGEFYNLDNILCWGKMAMEHFLATGDGQWFTPARFRIITTSMDYILTHFREKYNPTLVHAGIEGDWTECTNWEADNANVTANMLRSLQLAVECQQILGDPCTKLEYQQIYDEMLQAFNKPLEDGGYWSDDRGYYVHGNDGTGYQVFGDQYFESTVNYFSLLWSLAPEDHRERIWEYLDAHRDKIELPYPVLTNYKPRTAARRTRYGRTVTNGDVWMVLGGHAAAARLQAGYVSEGTGMFRAIVDFEREHGTLHNCIYQNGSVNDSWSPEVANYGALYAPLVLGVLGIRPLASGLHFNIARLKGLSDFGIDLFFQGEKFRLSITWAGVSMEGPVK